MGRDALEGEVKRASYGPSPSEKKHAVHEAAESGSLATMKTLLNKGGAEQLTLLVSLHCSEAARPPSKERKSVSGISLLPFSRMVRKSTPSTLQSRAETMNW
jgi:hypothetical protein